MTTIHLSDYALRLIDAMKPRMEHRGWGLDEVVEAALKCYVLAEYNVLPSEPDKESAQCPD